MPEFGRWVSAGLGVLFLVLAPVVLWQSGAALGPVAGAILLAVLGLDLLVAAGRGRWPVLTGFLFLP